MHGSVRTHIHVVCRRTEMHLMHASVLTNINAGSDVHLMHGSMLPNIQHVVAFLTHVHRPMSLETSSQRIVPV